MSITDYASLQAAIADWLNRSDLTTVIPDFITMVDAEMVRTREARQIQEATLADGTGTLFIDLFNPASAVPLKDKATRYISLFISGVQDADDPEVFNPPLRAPVIELTSMEQLFAKRSALPTAGITRFAAVRYDRIHLAPLPDTVYEYTLVYDAHLELSDTQTTNKLLTLYPDVYLYGALVHAAPYIKDDERMPMWRDMYDRAKAEMAAQNEKLEWPNTPIATQPRVFT